MEKKKNKSLSSIGKINHSTSVIISVAIGLLIWKLYSMTDSGSVIFASPERIVMAAVESAKRGDLWRHIVASFGRIVKGFSLAFVFAVPIAIVMGWYKTVCSLIEPWIQFIRNIPPIAYIPIIVVAFGVREKSKVAVIFIAAFLTMVITIYQGVRNVDPTLIKAARVLGANDMYIFFTVVVPASLPFVFTAIYLGLGASLTALVAAEMTGAQLGLGTMIQTASQFFQMDVVLMGIVIIGVMGLLLLGLVKHLEKKFTGWQERNDS